MIQSIDCFDSVKDDQTIVVDVLSCTHWLFLETLIISLAYYSDSLVNEHLTGHLRYPALSWEFPQTWYVSLNLCESKKCCSP